MQVAFFITVRSINGNPGLKSLIFGAFLLEPFVPKAAVFDKQGHPNQVQRMR